MPILEELGYTDRDISKGNAQKTLFDVTIKTQNIVQLKEAYGNIDLIPENAVWVRLEYAGVKYENGQLVLKNRDYDRLFWQLLHELKQRNKKIWLVIGVPEGTTHENYQKAIRAELTLIPDLLPNVDVIQVGNEMDCHDFIGYKPIPGCDWKNYDGDAYTKRVLYFVEKIGEKVQQYNNSNWDGRHVGLAVNLTGWPLMNGNISREKEFVRQLSNYVDTVGLDLYRIHGRRSSEMGTFAREDGTKKPAYYAIFGGASPGPSLKEALEKELHKWYPEKEKDVWELNVTKTVQKIYPNVLEANLSGTYDILDYWKVSSADDYPGLPEENYGWYFVKIPAKLSLKRAGNKESNQISAEIVSKNCYEDVPERMRPIGVGCVEYEVNVTPNDTEYNFIVYAISGKITKEEQAKGDQTFKITWPPNPTIPNYDDLVVRCAAVKIDGNTVASTCTAPQQPTKKWDVRIESPYKYTYEIHGNTLHLTVYVNYTARNSCYSIKAVAEPLRCPNCYEVKIVEIVPTKNQTCAEVIRTIPTVSVDIPLSNVTNKVSIKVVKVELGGTPPTSPIICVKIEAKGLRIQQELRNCKISCTDEERKRIMEEISALKDEVQRNGCKISIPEPVFPTPPIKEPKPPEKPVVPPQEPVEPQKPKLPAPKPMPHVPQIVQPITQIWNNITRWLSIIPRIW